MKILHISNYYHPHIGGIEQVARDCVRALDGKYEQRLVCFATERQNARDEIDNIEIVRAGTLCKVASQSVSLKFGKILKREFAEFEPDIVVFHYPNPLEAHSLLKALKKRPNCKLVLYWHLDITKQKLLGKLFCGQTLRLLRRAERVVATSPNYIGGSKFLPDFREKCVVVPNCADAERITADGKTLALAEEIKREYEGKTILFALGRHVPYKGMEYLVRASRLLGEEYAVLIGGKGELTDSLKALAAGDDKVRFLGRIEEDMLKAYMCACDIFCFPSVTKNEAFGIALAEAMAYGKPAVTFTIAGSGVNYVSLSGVTGLEVENGNVEKYAEAIELLAHDDELRTRCGDAARERVQALFTEEKFRENVQKLIDGIALG